MTKQKPMSVVDEISATMYRSAKSLDDQGMVQQALVPYLKLIERFPDSQEAQAATERVIAIANGLSAVRRQRMAITILEKLDAARASSGSEPSAG
jgi:hypothetical protein